MSNGGVRRAGILPAHMRGRVAPVGGQPVSTEETLADVLAPVTGMPRPVTTAPVQPGEAMFPCPCGCQCGNLTTIPARKVAASRTLQMLLRCEDCARKGGVHQAGSPVPVVERKTVSVKRDPIDAELDQEADAEVRRLQFQEQWAKWQASVPEKFRHADLDDRVLPRNAQAIQVRLDLLRRGEPAGALIFGKIGSGKTYLGYAYANLALKAGLIQRGEIKHGTEVELLGKIATADWSERSRLLKELLSPRLKMLFIDDVGREMRTKPADRRALYDEIANLAWANGRALILTTNLLPGGDVLKPDKDGALAPDEVLDEYLAGWVGAAAYSRIKTSVGPSNIVTPDRQMRDELWEEYKQQQRGQ
jgi:DNA replication protein DnaC